MEKAITLFELASTVLVVGILVLIFYLLVKKISKEFKTVDTGVTSFDLIADNPAKSLSEDKYADLDMKSFDDIAGLTELKVELRKFLAVFNNQEAFVEKSVSIPRGILLWGTPGCGKTSLAKAIAKEANVNFLCRNAADLVSGYSMSNENKIGELFKKARENAPCVIFIDELDIIGERYTGGMGAGAHQVEVTRLLAEMDGFQKNENILVIGATNDIAKLDKALLRSGRFSKKFHVGMPQKREDILAVINMYKGNKPFEEGITDDDLIKTLGRLTPADIKELLNECGIYAVMSNSCITLDLLNKTILELNLGTNLVESDKAMSPEKKRLLAVHEAAHALVGRALGFGITGVSLVGTQTGVGGMTYVKVVPNNHEWQDMMIPSNSYTTYEMVLSSVVMGVAGAVGELLDNGGNFLKVSTGCKEDLARNYDMLADFVKCYSLDLKHLTCLKATGVEGLIYALQCICNDIAKEILETNKSIYYSFVDALVRTGELREADINILSEGLKGYVLDYNSLLDMFNNYTTSMDTEAVFKYNV